MGLFVSGKRFGFIGDLAIWLTLVGAFSAVVLLTGPSASAATDCDNNAVVYCGVSSTGNLVNKYNNGDGHNSAASIRHIYSDFGISSSDIAAIGSTSQMGSVSSNGDVSVGGKVVATNALTAGRQGITSSCGGSTRQDVGGTVFYTRKPCVSFASSPLSAYVVMKNNTFQYAILTSCGNPVKATPKAPPAPKPAPKPTPKPAPAPKPAPVQPAPVNVCSGNTTNSNSGVASQGGNCSINTVVQTPPPSASGQCTSLELQIDQTNPLSVTATANSAAQNGAQLQSIQFDFGDGVAVPATSQQTMSHTYQQAGTYLVKATLTFSGDTSGVPSVCQAPITVTSAQPTCDQLALAPGDDQTVTISQFQITANGGSFTGADIDWGDGNTQASANPVIGQTHQYANPGTYTVNVVPHFTVNGQDITASSQNCQQQVTFAAATPPPTTPSTPTAPAAPSQPASLVNTGPGSVIGVFAAASGLGMLAYRRLLRRRLS